MSKKKKKRKKGKKERKKKRRKKKQKQKQKNTTQKTHRPYSSLDLTDPNFHLGEFFYNFARIIKKSAVLILSKIF